MAEFLDRIKNPKKYPFIENEDGTISTHKMSAERDEEGNWYAFPTIVQLPDGSLYEFKDVSSAMSYNLRTKNFKSFGKNKDKALEYARGGYKKGTPLETFSKGN